ncbi:uncharacterized protein LOC112460455 isoform X1 [Temnothorax curvispinosus]|uniref:Uncharacterized protein LOC112460455 isoform X1 n=1 Tax=Temnothorax curvispinosus TaxID=300111 RepID=A0A6J1QEX7_9HYME|nr:uncharacterized protein LOC112460455 isoform X1 [Temnothorax curvispinosus]
MDFAQFANVDEIIIDFVRDNKCLYDKSDPNFRNTVKKKEMWSKISENLKLLYRVDMPVEAIEKRWSSLRDMFSRENRKQKLPPSGSGYEPAKEWELYRNMLFLLPHIVHRRSRTKSLFIPLNQSVCSVSKTSPPNVNNLLPSEESKNLDHSLPSCDLDYNGPNGFIKDNEPSIDNEETVTIEHVSIKRPVSAMSNCSSTSSTQFPVASTSSRSEFKPIKENLPELDQFAKRKKIKDEIEHDLEEARSAISTAIKTILSKLYDQKQETNGYMAVIEEGFSFVPSKNKIQCLIEILQIIQKYEERP